MIPRFVFAVMILAGAVSAVAGEVDEAEAKRLKADITELIKVLSDEKEKENMDLLVPKTLQGNPNFEKKMKGEILATIAKERESILKCLIHVAQKKPDNCVAGANRSVGLAHFKLDKKEFGKDRISFFLADGKWFIK